jgi:hypothetical protein
MRLHPRELHDESEHHHQSPDLAREIQRNPLDMKPRLDKWLTINPNTIFLGSIKHVGRMNVSRHILVLDTSILMTCFIKRREHYCAHEGGRESNDSQLGGGERA